MKTATIQLDVYNVGSQIGPGRAWADNVVVDGHVDVAIGDDPGPLPIDQIVVPNLYYDGAGVRAIERGVADLDRVALLADVGQPAGGDGQASDVGGGTGDLNDSS